MLSFNLGEERNRELLSVLYFRNREHTRLPEHFPFWVGHFFTSHEYFIFCNRRVNITDSLRPLYSFCNRMITYNNFFPWIEWDGVERSWLLRGGYVNTEKVLYCFYKIFLKIRESKTSQPCLHTLILYKHTCRPMKARVVSRIFHKSLFAMNPEYCVTSSHRTLCKIFGPIMIARFWEVILFPGIWKKSERRTF